MRKLSEVSGYSCFVFQSLLRASVECFTCVSVRCGIIPTWVNELGAAHYSLCEEEGGPHVQCNVILKEGASRLHWDAPLLQM